MATGKVYYWLRLKKNFMTSDTVDFLMSQPEGANYVVLYQMLHLMSINTEGRLSRTIGDVIIPYDVKKIQRDTKWFTVDTINVALSLFMKLGLVYRDVDGVLVMADHKNLIGSETDYAEQKRVQRNEKASSKALPQECGQCPQSVHSAVHTEIRDKSIENREKKEDANASKKEGGKTAFRAPSIEDVEAYCKSEGFDQTDADDFVNFYQKKGWRVGKDKMKDWKAAVRNWENSERRRRGLPTIGEMRKAAEKKNREAEILVEYPVGSGRMIPEVQARREANRDGAFVEYPTGSGKFIPVYEAEAIRKGKPVNGK